MSSSSSNSKKKQLDDKNLKALRELAALLPNKQCFDCNQRGPTYVNMMIGSFVCTSCSGLLRGLNPPHRVKSIAMATFTNDEIEFLKTRGNEYCRHVWMGRYDRSGGARTPFDDGVGIKDETQIKDYLVMKYEKKRWYVSPSEAFANTPPPQQHISSSTAGQQQQQQLHQQQQNSNIASSPRPVATHTHSQSHSSALSRPQAHQLPPVQQHPHQQQSADLFARHNEQENSKNSNPVNSTASSSANVLFDPFGLTSANTSASPPSTGMSFAQHQQMQNVVPKSATVPSGFLMPHTAQLQPTPFSSHQHQHQQHNHHQHTTHAAAQQPSAGDKYSALAELDELFHTAPAPETKTGERKAEGGIGAPSANLGAYSVGGNHFFNAPAAPLVTTGANPFTNGVQHHPAGHAMGGQQQTGAFGSFPNTANVNMPGSTATGGFFNAGVGGNHGFFAPSAGPLATNAGQQMMFQRPGVGLPAQYPQASMMQMPPANPFLNPPGGVRPTNAAPSWNPFL